MDYPPAQELRIIDKVYDLSIWSADRVAKFPRSHKFNLGDRLQTRLYDLLEMLLSAKFTRERIPILQQANLELELLRFQLRMAKDLKCISMGSYVYAAKMVNEVGQLLGGWIKSSTGQRRR